jgi:hypothetical protein
VATTLPRPKRYSISTGVPKLSLITTCAPGGTFTIALWFA